MVVNLVNRIDRDNFTSYVVSLSNDNPLADQIHPEAAQFIALPRSWRFDMHPALQIRKIIIEIQINTIMAFDIFSFFYVWYALRNIETKPNIFISIHNSHFKNYKDLLKNIAITRILSGEEKFISVSNTQADWWANTYHIPRERFLTIYNGVDTDLFCPENNLTQKRKMQSGLEIPDNAYVILQVASLTPEKRHEDSLSALKHINDINDSNRFFLVFVGDGPEKYLDQLQQMAFQLGISKRVMFCGVQNDIKLFYTAADIFTLTSSSETFSVAALEAMSMGLPCVLTDVGGAREMVVEGMNGYLVEPKNPDSIAQGWMEAFNNENHLDHEKIRNWVIEHFSLTDCVNKYEDLLRQ